MEKTIRVSSTRVTDWNTGMELSGRSQVSIDMLFLSFRLISLIFSESDSSEVKRLLSLVRLDKINISTFLVLAVKI